MFTLQNIKQERLDLPDRSIEMVESNMSIAKFDLSLTAYEVEEGLFVSFEYNTDLFDSSTIARMAGHFENWLNEITYHPMNHIQSCQCYRILSKTTLRRME